MTRVERETSPEARLEREEPEAGREAPEAGRDNVLCIPGTVAVGVFVMVYKSGASGLLYGGTLSVTPTQAIAARYLDANNEILEGGQFLCLFESKHNTSAKS